MLQKKAVATLKYKNKKQNSDFFGSHTKCVDVDFSQNIVSQVETKCGEAEKSES